MSKKKIELIILFTILPIAIIVGTLVMARREREDLNNQESLYENRDAEINSMLLEEYQKSQSTRQSVEITTEYIAPFEEGVAEIEEMYADGTETSEPEDSEPVEADLTSSDEDIIAAAEQKAKEEAEAAAQTANYAIQNYGYLAGGNTGDFVLDITPEEMMSSHPLFLQYDPRWAGYPYGMGTMQSSACGPTCFSMVIVGLTDIDAASPPRVAAYSMNHGYYVPGAGTSHQLFIQGCYDFGLYCESVDISQEAMQEHLDRGEMLILSCRNGNFTHSGAGHFIVIYGYDNNGFMVNDPASIERSGYYWPFSVIQSDIVKIYALGRYL